MTTKENTSIHLYTHKNIEHSQDLECDVCIVGSGVGGATLAGLVEQGLDVIVLESGQHRWRKDFDMNEAKSCKTFTKKEVFAQQKIWPFQLCKVTM